MPETITLPDGTMAVLRSAKEVPERKRREHLNAQSRMLEASGMKISESGEVDTSDFSPSSLVYQGPVHDTLILCHVQSWSRPEAIDRETVQDLPAEIYDFLLAESQSRSKGMVLDTSPDDGNALDPKAHIEP